jgi:hypothetical protein
MKYVYSIISEHTMVKKLDQKKVNSTLRNIYYSLSEAGAYLGPDKL